MNRFADRQIYLVRSRHRFGDPFGPMIRDRVQLDLLRGESVRIGVHAVEVDARAGTAFMRIGNGFPLLSTSGLGPLAASWTLTPDVLGTDRTVVVAVGVTLAPPGAPAPTMLTNEWYACVSYARVVDGGVEILTPCDGITHYQFPDGRTTFSHEDVSPAMRVRLSRGRAGLRGRIRS